MAPIFRLVIAAAFAAAVTLVAATNQTYSQKSGDQKSADQKTGDAKKDEKKADDQKKDAKKPDEKKPTDLKKLDKKIKTLTDKDKYAKIPLVVGEKLNVRLPANPSTGYTWIIVPKADDKLRLDGPATYEADEKDKQLAGAGGNLTFTFIAQTAGETEVQLQYLRPFEKGRDPQKTFSFTVRIQ
jgi:inhibitor of cysteine peptidase